MKKVLYLSADFGEGHNSAVRAVREALDKHYPGVFEHRVLDVASLIGPTIDKVIEAVYKGSVRSAKRSYSAFFRLTDKYTKNDPDKGVYRLLKPSFNVIEEIKPDIVVSCFPLLTYSVSRYFKEKGNNVPFVALITDTGDVHNIWVSQAVDYYLVPSRDTGFFLEMRGVPKDKIKTLGFPVRQMFYSKMNKTELKKKYNIPAKKKVVCYFSGAFGIGKTAEKVKEIDKTLKDIFMIIICGRNQKLFKEMSNTRFYNEKLILGYVNEIAEIYEVSDLIITKAGGLSTMELVTSKKPSIITEVTPGQEEPNAQFIESQGFGYVEKNAEDLAKRTKYIIETQELSRLQNNLNNYHLNENADKRVAKFILDLVK